MDTYWGLNGKVKGTDSLRQLDDKPFELIAHRITIISSNYRTLLFNKMLINSKNFQTFSSMDSRKISIEYKFEILNPF